MTMFRFSGALVDAWLDAGAGGFAPLPAPRGGRKGRNETVGRSASGCPGAAGLGAVGGTGIGGGAGEGVALRWSSGAAVGGVSCAGDSLGGEGRREEGISGIASAPSFAVGRTGGCTGRKARSGSVARGAWVDATGASASPGPPAEPSAVAETFSCDTASAMPSDVSSSSRSKC